MYFIIDGVKYWIMLGPSGPTLYRREGSKTKYLGRRPLEEVKRLLAQAGAEAVQKIKAELEAVKQAVESQKTTATTQPSLTWKKDGHTYWLLLYAKSVYIYMKGPSTKHRPKLVEKTDINGVIGRAVAAGAFHVLEALRALVNGLHAAVSDLSKPQATSDGAQKAREAPRASRREAEAALKELKRELSRAAARWDEAWRMKTGGLEEPDAEWLREKLRGFASSYIRLLEKIQPYEDLLDKLADAVAEATHGHLTRTDALRILKP